MPTLSINIQTDTKIVSLFHDILNYSKFGLAYCICFYLLSILRWIRNSLCLRQILPALSALNGLWLPGAENRLAGVWAKSRAWWRGSIKLSSLSLLSEWFAIAGSLNLTFICLWIALLLFFLAQVYWYFFSLWIPNFNNVLMAWTQFAKNYE